MEVQGPLCLWLVVSLPLLLLSVFMERILGLNLCMALILLLWVHIRDDTCNIIQCHATHWWINHFFKCATL
jgi:hypothetical protein